MNSIRTPLAESAPSLFEAFASSYEGRVRQALVASYGLDAGTEAASVAMTWAWEHTDRLAGLANPVAYLFRVGQSSMRRTWRYWQRNSSSFPPETAAPDSFERVDLADVLTKLSTPQRVSVLLIHAHGWTYDEVAVLLGVSVEAVTNHVHRGTKKLRTLLKEES